MQMQIKICTEKGNSDRRVGEKRPNWIWEQNWLCDYFGSNNLYFTTTGTCENTVSAMHWLHLVLSFFISSLLWTQCLAKAQRNPICFSMWLEVNGDKKSHFMRAFLISSVFLTSGFASFQVSFSYKGHQCFINPSPTPRWPVLSKNTRASSGTFCCYRQAC